MNYVLALLALMFCSGCAYSQKEVFPTEVATVALPIFENKSFYRHLELDVTEALAKEVETRTPYKVVWRNRADTILEGSIVSVRQIQTSRQRQTGLPNEVDLQVVVDVVWKDMRSGEILRERRGLTVVGRYIPARMVGDTLKTAEFQVAQNLAHDVVSVMRVGM